MISIFISEEYGYRTWLWEYPHSKEQLIKDWQAGKAPLNFYDPSYSEFDGELSHLTKEHPKWLEIMESNPNFFGPKPIESLEDTCDAWAHVHDDDDTELRLDGNVYPGKADYCKPPTSKE
jgi:hypothetical protein